MKEIIKKLEYHPSLLDVKRTKGIIYKLRKEHLTNEHRMQSQTSPVRVRRPPKGAKYSEIKSLDAIKAMEVKLTYLRKEVGF